MSEMYGYVRVSTKEQHEDRQIIAITSYGVREENIYIDHVSGKNFDRPAYIKLIRKIKNDDVLVTKSIDRFGRNYEEILGQWRLITKEKKAAIVVLDMPLLDTRQSKSLTGVLIADIVLQLLSYVAETEREYIRRRQAEGIAAAKARGVTLGAKPMQRPAEFVQYKAEWQEGTSLPAKEHGGSA